MQGLDAGEHLERGVLDDVGHFDELQVDAKVGLVGAVLGHGVVPVHDGERVLEVDVEDFLEDRADEFFHQARISSMLRKDVSISTCVNSG